MKAAVKPHRRSKPSIHRNNLSIASWEGLPSVIFQTLLGGQFLTGFLLYLGATSGELGFVLAITTFVNIAQIAVAFLIQRLRSRRRPLIIFIILHRTLWGTTGLVPFLFPKEYWVPAFIVLYMVTCVFGTISGMLWSSVISDLVPQRVRGRYFGIRNTLLNAAGTVILFAGGVLLDHYPQRQGFLILYIVVWICIAANIAIFFFYPDIPFERSDETKFWPMLQRPLKDASFIQSTAFLAGFLFLQNLVVPLYSYIMLQRLNLSYQTVSLMNIMQTLSMMGSFYVWGNLNAKFSNKKLLYWTLPLVAASCLLWGALSVFPTLLVLLAAHAFLGIGIGGFNQLAFNFMIGDTPKKDRPMYMATYSAITGMASFFGPLLGGKLQEWLGDAPDWVQVYGMQLAVGAGMLVLVITLGKRILLR
ncbi:MFS transporter [Paenibacillus pinistramenti]|uniref:MFS transporter n=1 Tax=Paenibacillus pinistramenti TaxID=1768003 RepID=UPI001108F8DA|nr:MFS transporter [Paenibacillus pinistramenti]